MNFQESVDYLLSLGNEVSAMKLGLESVRALLGALGNPEKKYLKVQVAGTNGKGSVCAFLNSICLQAGIKTGMYTSPHLVSITERIEVDGVDISEESFARLATSVRLTSEKLVQDRELDAVPTFFEQVTAIALVAFAEGDIELAILETGLGGRLDATTAANAEIAAITRIDLDHQQYLGETMEEIAAEKAAIIHEGSRVVIGAQEPEAMKVLLERCREFGIVPELAMPSAFPPLGLAGNHQIENASIAVAIAKLLREHFSISDENIRHGLESARHPGRLEFDGRFLFDGAHNVGGARALRNFLDEFVPQPITVIFGSMEDKDVKQIAEILFPKADKLVLTQPANSRALAAGEIRSLADVDGARVYVTENVDDAIRTALDVSGAGDLILVTGSLYLIGEVRRLLLSGVGDR